MSEENVELVREGGPAENGPPQRMRCSRRPLHVIRPYPLPGIGPNNARGGKRISKSVLPQPNQPPGSQSRRPRPHAFTVS
jgi:hypothetical protein